MQERPSRPPWLEFAPVRLQPDFPFIGGDVSPQGDAPITRLHVHDCLEVGYCFDGSGVFVIEDKIFPFSAGDVCVINNAELHLAQSAPGTVSHWTWMMMDPVRLIGPVPIEDTAVLRMADLAGPGFRNLLSGKSHPDIREVAERIVEESRGRKPGHRAAIRALVWQLMVLLHRLPGVGRQAAAPEQTGQGIGRVAPALEHLARHCADAISIPELAARCHMSVTNFRRVFRRATGQSPHPYLTNLRLQMASTLLSGTDRKVLDVSLTVGYVTLSSFNRHFRAAFGMTPLEWRRGRLLTSRTGKLTRSGQKKRQTGN